MLRYFAASVKAADVNQRFADSLGIRYPILSDVDKQVAQAYGVLSPSGYASRSTFYIGADRRILDIDTKVSAASHGGDVIAIDRTHKLTSTREGRLERVWHCLIIRTIPAIRS